MKKFGGVKTTIKLFNTVSRTQGLFQKDTVLGANSNHTHFHFIFKAAILTSSLSIAISVWNIKLQITYVYMYGKQPTFPSKLDHAAQRINHERENTSLSYFIRFERRLFTCLKTLFIFNQKVMDCSFKENNWLTTSPLLKKTVRIMKTKWPDHNSKDLWYNAVTAVKYTS